MLAGATLVPLSGWPWPVMCLSVANTRSLASGRLRSLKAAHRCDAQLADEVGVFAVGFLDAAPARVAPDVDDGSEHELHAARANLPPRHREYAFEQRRIPAARERNGLRKVRRAAGRVAVQSFLVKQHRDAEARAARVALHGVDQLDGLAHVPIRES